MDLSGTLLASAEIEYLKMDASRITDADFHDEMCYLLEDGLAEIE